MYVHDKPIITEFTQTRSYTRVMFNNLQLNKDYQMVYGIFQVGYINAPINKPNLKNFEISIEMILVDTRINFIQILLS